MRSRKLIEGIFRLNPSLTRAENMVNFRAVTVRIAAMITSFVRIIKYQFCANHEHNLIIISEMDLKRYNCHFLDQQFEFYLKNKTNLFLVIPSFNTNEFKAHRTPSNYIPIDFFVFLEIIIFRFSKIFNFFSFRGFASENRLKLKLRVLFLSSFFSQKDDRPVSVYCRSGYASYPATFILLARLFKARVTELLHSYVYLGHIGYDKRLSTSSRLFPDKLVNPRPEVFENLIEMGWREDQILSLETAVSKFGYNRKRASNGASNRVAIICQHNQIRELVGSANLIPSNYDVVYRLHPARQSYQKRLIAELSCRKFDIESPRVEIEANKYLCFIGSYSTLIADLALKGYTIFIPTVTGRERLADLARFENVNFSEFDLSS